MMRVGAVALAFALLAAPLAAEAQPALEQFRFDPSQLCYRGTFQWGFSYRGFPGGLAAVKDLELWEIWGGRPATLEGGRRSTGEQRLRSDLAPTRDDLRRYTGDHGRFESWGRPWDPPRGAPVGDIDIRYTLRIVLADGQELTIATSVRQGGSCPPPTPFTTLTASPIGRIDFRTTTPTIPEFLQGVRIGATDRIWGDLEFPRGDAERSAAVVLVRGSGGVGVFDSRWAFELRRAGLATFVLDSFTGRGIPVTAEDESQLNSLAMIGDAYRALELLATHPRIDPTRITVMGFSKGGVVALYSALTRFQRLHGPAGIRFAHHIAFYPSCYYTFVGDETVSDRPIRIFHGMADDLARIEPCRAYMERLRQAGADAEIAEYAGAQHGFAHFGDWPPRGNPREPNYSGCFWEERPEGRLVSRDTGHPFSVNDPCMVLGGTSGPDPAAYRQVLQAVKALVGTEGQPSP
jgi:dienelactone hydrolase